MTTAPPAHMPYRYVIQICFTQSHAKLCLCIGIMRSSRDKCNGIYNHVIAAQFSCNKKRVQHISARYRLSGRSTPTSDDHPDLFLFLYVTLGRSIAIPPWVGYAACKHHDDRSNLGFVCSYSRPVFSYKSQYIVGFGLVEIANPDQS